MTIKFSKMLVGTWETEFRDENKALQKEKVTILPPSSLHNMVTGSIEVLDPKNPSKTTEKYNLWGRFHSRMLTGVYFPSDKNEFEQGAFVLEQTSKTTFEGQYIFYIRKPPKKNQERIIASEYTWKKQNGKSK